MDGIAPYRLEMMAGARVSGTRNLYDFWGAAIYKAIRDESGIFINLASKEYSRCIELYMTAKDTLISFVFGELKGSDIVQKTVHVKMARGEMVRYMAENNLSDAIGMKQFSGLGFSYDDKRSTQTQYVFLK